jgi:uncharacterized Zn-binding protein involved in type VI secretion
MEHPVRKGDKLENGGEVASGSPSMQFMGKPVARQGDKARCALHGETTIDEGKASFRDKDGKPIALHHHRCACGCRLLASLGNVRIA